MPTAFTRVLRAIGSVVLWTLALVGVACAGLWAANTAGLVQPLIVVSGSMSPGIETGDLLFARPTPATELTVGDVATLHSQVTDKLVTHRIIEVMVDGDEVQIRMQGDANNAPDGETYVVPADSTVWQPVLTVPGGGYFVTTLMRPAVAIPGVIGILALVSLTLFPSRRSTTPSAGTGMDAATTPEAVASPEPAPEPREEALV